MSRCVLDNEKTGSEVAIGWDPGLNTFFAQVIQPEEDEPSIWLGKYFDEYLTPEKLIEVIRPWACQFDTELLFSNLMQDKETNSDRLYSIDI